MEGERKEMGRRREGKGKGGHYPLLWDFLATGSLRTSLAWARLHDVQTLVTGQCTLTLCDREGNRRFASHWSCVRDFSGLTTSRSMKGDEYSLYAPCWNQGRSDGVVYRYIYPPKISPWKLFCALIAADVVRLLVYRTVVSCSKKLYPPKMNFWLHPWLEYGTLYPIC